MWSRSLSAVLAESHDVIGSGTEVLYLDVPNHFNIGDLLIYSGACQFLDDCGARMIGRHSWATWRPELLSGLPESVTIVMHGGGNFGDIYDSFQKFREEVVAACPNHRIVFFPQSIHYKSKAAQEVASHLLRKHKRLTIMCRDHESLEVARTHFSDDSRLCPDMAHALSSRFANAMPGEGTLIFRRRDVEATSELGGQGFDWGDILGFPVKPAFSGVRMLQKLERRSLITADLSSKAAVGLQSFVIRRAMKIFEQKAVIDTDRLHAVILGLMMGRRIVAHDNIYGKIRRYADCWLGDEPLLELTSKRTA